MQLYIKEMMTRHFISKNYFTPQKVIHSFSTPLHIKEMILPLFISKKIILHLKLTILKNWHINSIENCTTLFLGKMAAHFNIFTALKWKAWAWGYTSFGLLIPLKTAIIYYWGKLQLSLAYLQPLKRSTKIKYRNYRLLLYHSLIKYGLWDAVKMPKWLLRYQIEKIEKPSENAQL